MRNLPTGLRRPTSSHQTAPAEELGLPAFAGRIHSVVEQARAAVDRHVLALLWEAPPTVPSLHPLELSLVIDLRESLALATEAANVDPVLQEAWVEQAQEALAVVEDLRSDDPHVRWHRLWAHLTTLHQRGAALGLFQSGLDSAWQDLETVALSERSERAWNIFERMCTAMQQKGVGPHKRWIGSALMLQSSSRGLQ